MLYNFEDTSVYHFSNKGLLIPGCELTIAGTDGKITVSGNMNTRINEAVQLAKREGLINECNTSIYTSISDEDTDIAVQVLTKLFAETCNKIKLITLQLYNGNVLIAGEVFPGYDKGAIINFIKSLKNVYSVTGNLNVTNNKTVDCCVMQICKALQDTGTINMNQVTVTAEKDNVILEGSVHSMAEKEEATLIALATGKGRKVDNRLQTETSELIF